MSAEATDGTSLAAGPASPGPHHGPEDRADITSDPIDALTGRILVVDDNDMNRDMLGRRLERRGHRVSFARNGQEALDTIAAAADSAAPFDVVLLDVMMPVLNGFDALTRLRQTRSPQELPVIMATAKDQPDDVVKALRLGANDYVVKPLAFEVVLARVQTQIALRRGFARIQSLRQDLAHRNAELESANRRMKRDLEMAARVQRSTLPTELPEVPGLNVAWYYHPCDQIGGDSLNVFPLSDRFVGLYVLDVSGHGVPAALLSVTLTRELTPKRHCACLLTGEDSPIAPGITAPASLARQLNRAFPMDPQTLQYFTLLYGVLDLHTRELHYVSAGHPGFVHARRHDGGGGPAPLPIVQETPGFPVGILADADYEQAVVQLGPGDRLYLYSDGIPDAMTGHGECFGVERLRDSVARGRGRPLEQSVNDVVADVLSWCGHAARDDLSLLALELSG